MTLRYVIYIIFTLGLVTQVLQPKIKCFMKYDLISGGFSFGAIGTYIGLPYIVKHQLFVCWSAVNVWVYKSLGIYHPKWYIQYATRVMVIYCVSSLFQPCSLDMKHLRCPVQCPQWEVHCQTTPVF